ncbi:hypothetical protein ASPWEDRAFT_181210 [Aspergillus wentii DTO 134E9]|uniref:ARS binding protein Abp2 n=1 Tax=Aspergillus wentii DTO 134E9 TaxID=1073089 RepID=A0A1L9RY73_ASPWE|nr:uncharacterized protein ASPWEDRAFT_181210 [Aspergillus wentii DTO 134E9]KAI9931477.1 hypothetical protein MW887_010052 [Aspergillus wentii]OJJ39855.1 hypothetical protein ASPWEDRAFT_181210 [Aspergillus wentii DTO 134E9]
MENSFPSVMSQSGRGDLGGAQMVIQQYARYPLEPALHSASSMGSARSRIPASRSPPLHRKETPRSLQSSPAAPRSVIPPASTVRSGPSMSPPVFDPLRQRPARDSMDRGESRTLPSRDVTDESIDEAYINFILYCNPGVPLSVDTTELRKTFRSPPRSDGKSFSIFNLWELIRRLDNKDLKTWIQLAIELGVEPPSFEKKQSTQKVQQYTVRLKRWMRAMHVDAFFEYCLGHPHPYYTQLPPASTLVSESRDGVPLEEDLALRALVPQWKPKRGRKRAEDKESDEGKPVKRPQLDTSVGTLSTGSFPTHSATFPQSAIPFSAFPDDMESNDPWMTAASSFPADGASEAGAAQQGQDLRWRPLERDASPAGYPQSAIIPRGHHPSDIFLSAEPRSAVTPSSGEKARSRRRHGPAVSSAWPSSNGLSTGKTRGRPPSKGTVSGPFSTFPVNPGRIESPQVQNPGPRSSPAIVIGQDTPTHLSNPQYNQSPTPFAQPNGRPSKLQLQVPQHPGGPVRLATPPTLLVNGVTSTQSHGSSKPNDGPNEPSRIPIGSSNSSNGNHQSTQSGLNITTEDVIRVLSTELVHARLVGRVLPLSAEEARSLAVSIVQKLSTSYSQHPAVSPTIMLSIHLGLGHHFGITESIPSSMVIHARAPSVATFDGSGASGSAVYTVSHEYKTGSCISTKVTCSDLEVGNSNIKSDDAFKNDSFNNSIEESDGLTDAEFEDDGADSTVSETTWKQRYLKLRAQMQKKDRSLSQYKRKILESVMADI